MESNNNNNNNNKSSIVCHYEVLDVPRDADSSTIKKQHRKMALKYHPDKNLGDDNAAEQFRLIQQAYECLSDPQERKWYDEHRDAILAGWTTTGDQQHNKDGLDMIFNVVPFMHPGCYYGYDDDDDDDGQGFYSVYKMVFEEIVRYECQQSDVVIDLPINFGNSKTEWNDIQYFYSIWESFNTSLNFAWEDKYNSNEDGLSRRIRRLIDDDNKKARKNAKKIYNQDIITLVTFIKRRDPRVKAKRNEIEQQRIQQEKLRQEQIQIRKQEQKKAKQEWKKQAQQAMEDAEEEDRLAGRIRLADLEDDYDYGGSKKKKKRGKKNKKNKNKNNNSSDNDEEEKDKETQQQQQQQQNGEEVMNGDNDDEGKDIGVPSEEDGNTNDVEGSQATTSYSPKNNDEDDDNNNNNNSTIDEDEVPIVEEEENNGDYHHNDDYDDYESSEEEEESEPEAWRCICCRKDFKSEGQMENHMKSKKHKTAFKKYQIKLQKQQEQEQQNNDDILNDMMDELQV